MRVTILRLVVASIALIAVAYAVTLTRESPRWATWLLATGTNGLVMSLMALGAIRGDRLPRRLGWIFLGLFAACAGAFLFALAMPASEGPGGALLLGLPVRTAVVLYTVGVLPIFVLPFAYAYTFDATALEADELRRVREAYADVRASRGAIEEEAT